MHSRANLVKEDKSDEALLKTAVSTPNTILGLSL